MTSNSYTHDAIVIGTGQAGKPLAVSLAKAGWKTAVVERDAVGGSCINVGCTPTKTMVASARVAYLASRGDDYGVTTGAVKVDLARVRQRKRAIVASFRGGSEKQLERTKGLELFAGEAHFTGPHAVEVTSPDSDVQTLTAPKIFINTGTRPIVPPNIDAPDVTVLDNASIMELDSVPEHLLVLGGGYIGLEFGQMFRRFGSRVTIIQRGPQLLGREDPDVATEVAEILRGEDIEILLDTTVTAATRGNDGQIELTIRTPEGMGVKSGSHLLAAAGRRPNSDRLNLEAAGIKSHGPGFITVNERLETNVEGVYALGDVKGGPAFTHISYDDYRIVETNLLKGGSATTEGRLVPYTVFIDPQLGRVGLTESEARAQGRNIRVAKLPMTHVARAIEMDETRGFMKAIVDAETDQILGCAVLGVEGGEVMSVLQMAMMGGVPSAAIRNGVFAHPTLAESLNNLFIAMDKK
jgi:pyruvate/2-oxoglutarate dehydrogenase complex dihydrolipoamide dehydrogenase (E3) component